MEETIKARGIYDNMRILESIVEKLEDAGWQIKLSEDREAKDMVKEGYVVIENLKTGERRHYAYMKFVDGEFQCELIGVKRARITKDHRTRIEKNDETIDGLAYQLPAWE